MIGSKQGLLAWVVCHRSDVASREAPPSVAPVSEIATLMASDEFGQVDPEKRFEAARLLSPPFFQGRHLVVGKCPLPAPPMLISTARFRQPLLPGERLSTVRTMEEEARDKQRQQAAAGPLFDVLGLRFSDLLEFRDPFRAKGLWHGALDLLCGYGGVNTAQASKRDENVPPLGSVEAARIRNIEAEARKICQETKQPDLSISQSPKDLYPALRLIFEPRGYSLTQINRTKKDPKRFPNVVDKRGKRKPYQVVLLLLKEEPEYPVIKPKLMQSA